MNVSGIFSGNKRPDGLLCNGRLVSIGDIVPLKFGEKQEYWRLHSIRDRQPLWVPEESANGTSEEKDPNLREMK